VPYTPTTPVPPCGVPKSASYLQIRISRARTRVLAPHNCSRQASSRHHSGRARDGEPSSERRQQPCSPCDFLTVETIFLQRIYVLFFISLATRRIEYIACSSNPDGRWVTQQARNLVMQLGDEHPFRFLIHDHDTKFSHAFDEVFSTEGVKVIRTPVQRRMRTPSRSVGCAQLAPTASTGS